MQLRHLIERIMINCLICCLCGLLNIEYRVWSLKTRVSSRKFRILVRLIHYLILTPLSHRPLICSWGWFQFIDPRGGGKVWLTFRHMERPRVEPRTSGLKWGSSNPYVIASVCLFAMKLSILSMAHKPTIDSVYRLSRHAWAVLMF
jgi:hypothetical protein